MEEKKEGKVVPKDFTEENLNEKENRIKNKKISRIKIIVTILILILIYIIVSTARKMIILNNLSENVSTYINSSNSYVKIYGDLTNGYEYMEMYKKAEKIKIFSKMEDKDVFITTIETPNEFKYYIDTDEYKKLRVINTETYQKDIIENPISYDGTFLNKVAIAMSTKIETDKVNGSDCYILSSSKLFAFSNSYVNYDGKLCIEKDTGLILKKITNRNEKEYTTNYEYKFDENTDDDVKEPDTSQYEIEE